MSLGTLIFIAVLSANYFLSRFLLEEYVSQLAKTTTSSTVHEIENIFHTVATSTDSLATLVATSALTEKQIHQSIKAFLKANTDVFGMTVALEPHTLIESLGDFSPYYYKKENALAFSDLADNSYQYKNWPWYTNAKEVNNPVWSEPYLDTGGGNVLMTTYSTPIYLKDIKTFAGVATADIELSWLDKIVEQIKIGDTGFGFIVSRDDIIIAHPDSSLNMQKLIDTLDHDVIPENWQKYIDSKSLSSSVYLYSPCHQQQGFCWVAIEALGNTGWKVIIVIPEHELIAEISSLTIKISIIAFAGLLVLLFVITFITRHFTNPLASLAVATRDIGAGNLDAELPEPVRKDEIGALTADFSSMRSALKKYISKVQEATAKQQKIESEIQIAKDIQMSMIPGGGNISLEQNAYQLCALLRPARSVGGDLYYYQKIEDMLHFIIGDVSDKGIPAALFMAKTVTLYTRALKDKLLPGQTFTMMNDLLTLNNDACMFVTALCGSINLKTGKVVMANAGHMNPIIKSTQCAEEHPVNGATALGLMESVQYQDIKFQLSQHSSLIMYTDGISEAHDLQGRQYGDEKLIEFINADTSTDAKACGKNIIESVDNFAAGTEQFDDITLLIIRYE